MLALEMKSRPAGAGRTLQSISETFEMSAVTKDPGLINGASGSSFDVSLVVVNHLFQPFYGE